VWGGGFLCFVWLAVYRGIRPKHLKHLTSQTNTGHRGIGYPTKPPKAPNLTDQHRVSGCEGEAGDHWMPQYLSEGEDDVFQWCIILVRVRATSLNDVASYAECEC
jgi:hypothetical protein